MATVYYEVDGVTNVLAFDCTVSEAHKGSLTITRHKVERSADISDHVYENTSPLVLEVMVSNTPIRSIGKLQQIKKPVSLSTDSNTAPTPAEQLSRAPKLYGGWVSPFQIPFGPRPFIAPKVLVDGFMAKTNVQLLVEVLTFANDTDRLQDVWNAFRQLQKDKQLCSVSTRLEWYQDMILTDVSAPVTAQDAIKFTITFEPFQFVESLTFSGVQKVAAKKAKTKAAEDIKDQGPKTAYKLDARKQSLVDAGAQNAADSFVGAPTTATLTSP